MELYQQALSLHDYTVALRRHFHTWPECMPAEQIHTMERIGQELDALRIRHVRVPGGGIFGFIDGGLPGKTLLLRGDIDALPIQQDEHNLAGERTCVSQIPGVMHACGHDAHTAMLLTEARMLKAMEAELPGSIVLMFEEGEEGGGNIIHLCRYMDREGLRPDGAYACHTLWNLPSGTIGVTEGVSMCGLYHFAIHIHGQTGHGSRPDQGHNVIDCFAQIYAALQNVRMTAIDPAHRLTYSICNVHAGERHNVLPDTLRAAGTVRFDHVESGAIFMEKLRLIARSCGDICGCQVEIEQLELHHPVKMDDACRELFRNAVKEELGAEHVVTAPMWMASESFSHIADMIPTAFAFVGIRNEEVGSGSGHHTAKFDVDEAAMPWGIAAAVAYALAFLRTPPDTSAFRPMAQDMDSYLKLLGE